MKAKFMKKLFTLFMTTITSLAMAQEVPLLAKTSWDTVDAYYTYTIKGDKNFSNLEMLGATVKSDNMLERYYLTPDRCNQDTLKLALADSSNQITDQFFVRLFTIKSKNDFVAYSICYKIKQNELIFMNMKDILPEDLIQKFNVTNDTFTTKIHLYKAVVKTIDQLRDSFYLTDYYISPAICTKNNGYLITLTKNQEVASSSFVDLINPTSKNDSIALEMCKMISKFP